MPRPWEQQLFPFIKKLQIFHVLLPHLFQALPHLLSDWVCSFFVLSASFINNSGIITKILTMLIALIIKPFWNKNMGNLLLNWLFSGVIQYNIIHVVTNIKAIMKEMYFKDKNLTIWVIQHNYLILHVTYPVLVNNLLWTRSKFT